MLNLPTDVWMGNIFSLEISRGCVDGRTKRACANKVYHKSSPATPRAARIGYFFPFNKAILGLALGHISENTQFVYGERKSI